jgi:uncharacterized protein YecT (DUF1311 family)
MILPMLALLLTAQDGETSLSPEVEARYTKAFKTCTTTGAAAQGIQPAMTACASAEAERQDKILNSTYARVMSKRTKPAQSKLRLVQRSWIKQRDATCQKAQSDYAGGTMAPQVFYTCLAHESIKRTIWLERYKG